MEDHDNEEQPGTPSIASTLAQLAGLPANRSCADCHNQLIDSSQVHVAMSPLVARSTQSLLHAFRANHHEFAPPGHSKVVVNLLDPALEAAELFGWHGVFVCGSCGAAHKLLTSKISTVRAIQDSSAWTTTDAKRLHQFGGNARSWSVLEAYMPLSWQTRRPKPNSSIADRLIFVRAKYEALAFCLPPPGPLAPRAWRSLVDRNIAEWTALWGVDTQQLARMESITALQSASLRKLEMPAAGLPNRLVDFFCVIQASRTLDLSMQSKDLSAFESPDEVLLLADVTDCYPSKDSYDDLEFPEHVGSFVYPEGCRPSAIPLPPEFFTIVLTCSDGNRLYCGVLRLYDEHCDIAYMKGITTASTPGGEGPNWEGCSDVVYLPKCLVVMSHYGFFDIWRKFLLQIYRISLSAAPLPIERFIANFVSEVPLPPPGKVQVKFGFTSNDVWTIMRPRENELPLANFSFKPLFSCLSVTNILVVIGCLLQETPVVLLSQHHPLFTPVAEALVTLLFPFHWQGIYVPVLPYAMLDILEAPVPFLVGMHSRYLADVPSDRRPLGVVYVELDRDEVHLGYCDQFRTPRLTPSLPEKAAMKLRARLERYGSCVYALPNTGRAGAITTGDREPLPHGRRDIYAQVTGAELPTQSLHRKSVFCKIQKAYSDNELLTPLSGFLFEQGHSYEKEQPEQSWKKRKELAKFPFFRRNRSSANSLESVKSFDEDQIGAASILDLDESGGFSSHQIRHAFLRFFVSVFRKYRQYMGKQRFMSKAFLSSLGLSGRSMEFLETVLQTQLFALFHSERRDNPLDPEVVFFEESITAKVIRSKKSALIYLGRRAPRLSTSFLNDKSSTVTEIYTPPPPSNWGLPQANSSYHYGFFPRLDTALFGNIRSSVVWQSKQRRTSLRGTRRASASAHTREQVFATRTSGAYATFPTSAGNRPDSGPRNLEDALNILSLSFATSSDGSTPVEVDANAVAAAESVVRNARRKQAIIALLLIRLQSHCRKYLVRGRLPSHSIKTSVLRADCRGSIMASDKYVRRLQCWHRAAVQRKRFLALKRFALSIQCTTRSRNAVKSYGSLLFLVTRVQARVRAMLVKSEADLMLHQRLRLYRSHLLLLWRCTSCPLTYRVRFWPLISSESFVDVAIAENEIQRQWAKAANIRGTLAVSNDASQHFRFGLSAARADVYMQCQVLMEDHSEKNLSATFQPENGANARLCAERIQTYDRLSEKTKISSTRLMYFFHLFNISPKSKKKKLILVDSLWKDESQVDASKDLLLELFPELEWSADIQYKHPSRRALRRFPAVISSQLCPVPSEDLLNLNDRANSHIRRNVLEVARTLFLSHTVPVSDPKLEVDLRYRHVSRSMRIDALRSFLECNGDQSSLIKIRPEDSNESGGESDSTISMDT